MRKGMIGFHIRSDNNSLIGAIDNVEKLSTEFTNNWISKDLNETARISAEVGKYLDHIHGEILRHRDENKLEKLLSSPFADALNKVVGKIHEPVSSEGLEFFMKLEDGKGAFPTDALRTPLNLEDALNKIKHRGTQKFNFKVKKNHNHKIFIYTNGNHNHPDSIVSITMSLFCAACRDAAKHI